MMFNGSARFPDGDFDRILEAAGGSNNAYTTEEFTVYHEQFPAAAIATAFELEIDRMRALLIDAGRVDRERGVILSEREAGVDNDPVAQFLEEIQAVACAGTSYAHPVIGWSEDIERIDPELLGRFYDRHYRCSRPTVIGVGGIDPGHWNRLCVDMGLDQPAPGCPPLPSMPGSAGQHPAGERRIESAAAVGSPYLALVFPVPAATAASALADELLWTILVGGVASRLQSLLVERRAAAIALETYRIGRLVPGRQVLLVTLAPNKRPQTVERLLRETLEQLTEAGPTEAERIRAVNQRLATYYRHLESVSGRAELLGRAWTLHRDLSRIGTYPGLLEAVSSTEIRDAARAAFGHGGWTVGTLYPEGQ
jgi:zinc protease